jgi:hypothetical protein
MIPTSTPTGNGREAFLEAQVEAALGGRHLGPFKEADTIT